MSAVSASSAASGSVLDPVRALQVISFDDQTRSVDRAHIRTGSWQPRVTRHACPVAWSGISSRPPEGTARFPRPDRPTIDKITADPSTITAPPGVPRLLRLERGGPSNVGSR